MTLFLVLYEALVEAFKIFNETSQKQKEKTEKEFQREVQKYNALLEKDTCIFGTIL